MSDTVVRGEMLWRTRAACSEPDAPSMFEDAWGIGPTGRYRRSLSLAVCRRCPVKRECGQHALAEFDAGLPLYGIRCGIEFTEVVRHRQERDVGRLREVVEKIEQDERPPQ